jgi:hypothetical protein
MEFLSSQSAKGLKRVSKAIYLPFDTETGGIGPDVSILSASFAACDENWNILGELDLFTKPNDGIYKVTAESLSINHIDLIDHDKIACTYSEAGGRLREFIKFHSNNGAIKLIPMGKNVPFDVIKVTDNILGKATWNQYVSYRLYDITSLIIYLKKTGRLDEKMPDSLEAMAKALGVKFQAHTAKGDNHAGIEVIKWLESL